jgi:phage shock protein C
MTSAPFHAASPAEEPTPLPSAPPPPPQLRRSGTDRMLGGVCAGLAEYSRIDVVLWRVGFVVAALFGGAGVVIYLLLWILVPPAEPTPDRLGPLDRAVTDLHQRLTGNRTPPSA